MSEGGRTSRRWLEAVVDGALVVLLGVAILGRGAAHDATVAGVALAATLLAVGWVLVRRLRNRSVPGLPAPTLGLAFLSLVSLAQLIPVPLALRRLVSSRTAELLDAARVGTGGGGGWAPLSLDWPATALAVTHAAGLAALFFVFDGRARVSETSRPRLLAAFAVLSGSIAALALALHSAGSDSLLGLWSIEGTTAPLVSPFLNPNHFAGIVGAAALVALGFALDGERRAWVRIAAAFLVVACAAGVVASRSSGGIVAFVVGLVLFGVLSFAGQRCVLHDESVRRSFGTGVFVVAVVLVAVALAYVVGLGSWEDSEAAREGKLVPVRAAWRMALEAPVTGVGRGAFHSIHTAFLDAPASLTFTDVENELLQAAAEWGFLVALACAVGLALVLGARVRRAPRSLIEVGASCAAIVLVAQSFVDFSLQHAGGFVLVLLLADGHRPTSDARGSRTPTWRRPRAVLPALAVFAMFGLALGLPGIDADEARVAASTGGDGKRFDAVKDVSVRLVRRRPLDAVSFDAVVRAGLREGRLRDAAPWLNGLLSIAPTSGSAHLLAGEFLARAGRGAQARLEFRQAAELGTPSMAYVLARWRGEREVLEATPVGVTPVLHAARVLEANGLRPVALQALERAKDARPEEPLLATALFGVLMREGRVADGLAVAHALRRRMPTWPMGWSIEAEALRALDRPDEAGALYREGLKILPGDHILVVQGAAFEIGRGRPRAALDLLGEAPQDAGDEQRSEYAGLRAQALAALGRTEDALFEFRVALALRPGGERERLNLAEACIEAGRFDEAMATLVTADGPRAAGLRERVVQRKSERRNADDKRRFEQVFDGR